MHLLKIRQQKNSNIKYSIRWIFWFLLGNLGKKALANIVIPLVRDNLPGLVSNLTSNAINRFEIKREK